MSGHRFVWSKDAGVGEGEAVAVGQLPSTGPIGEFRRRATILSAPPPNDEGSTQPWVLASGDRVVKVYDLQAFPDELGRQLARDEAQTARRLADIDGVVTTFRAGEIGRWLVLEMERLGPTVQDVLLEMRSGRRTVIPPARLGGFFADAATALGEMHDRGLIHHDIKLDNLMLDRVEGRAVVADFSISARHHRRGRLADIRGTHVAPEQYRGQVGQSVDQYALAVAAREALGDEITDDVRRVLARGAAFDPADRYPTIHEFGVALRAALGGNASRRLSQRLSDVKPEWRITWAPTATALACVYCGLVYLRPHGLDLAGTVGSLLAAGTVVLISVRISARFRRARSQPRIRMADRGWFFAVLIVFLGAGLVPLGRENPSRASAYVMYVFVVASVIASLLGSVPQNAGHRAIAIAQRWERWLVRGGHSRARLWGSFGVMLAVAVAVLVLPAVATERSPRRPASAVRAASAAVVFVAELRTSLLGAQSAEFCGAFEGPRAAGVSSCMAWAPVAATWLGRDIAARRGIRFDRDDMKRISVRKTANSDSEASPSWALRTADAEALHVGAVERPGTSNVWYVSISRGRSLVDPQDALGSHWRYEVVLQDGQMDLTAVEVCDFRSARPCITLSQVEEQDLESVVREGAPGAE